LDAGKTSGVTRRRNIAASRLSHQHGAAVYVEDFAGNKAGIFGA
jgi:hypothetical protein